MRARPPRRKPDKLLRLGMELKANAGHRAQDRITPKQRARAPERMTSIDPLAVSITVPLRPRRNPRRTAAAAGRRCAWVVTAGLGYLTTRLTDGLRLRPTSASSRPAAGPDSAAARPLAEQGVAAPYALYSDQVRGKERGSLPPQ
jgi:hypothetical protein